jgi:hypothetical protein
MEFGQVLVELADRDAILAAARRTIIPARFKNFFHNFFNSLGY